MKIKSIFFFCLLFFSVESVVADTSIQELLQALLVLGNALFVGLGYYAGIVTAFFIVAIFGMIAKNYLFNLNYLLLQACKWEWCKLIVLLQLLGANINDQHQIDTHSKLSHYVLDIALTKDITF